MAVVFLVCYAMVESKPRYQYADFPVVNDPIPNNDLSRFICYYACEAANNGRAKTEKFGCGAVCCKPTFTCF